MGAQAEAAVQAWALIALAKPLRKVPAPLQQQPDLSVGPPGAILFRMAGWLDGRGARRVGDEALPAGVLNGKRCLVTGRTEVIDAATTGRQTWIEIL